MAARRLGRVAVAGGGAGVGWAAARRLGRVAVAGASMRPTLEPGDRLLVRRTRRLRPGDLAVLADPRLPKRSVVKRVAAVGDGRVTVLGDNPPASTDSRHYGPVALTAVEGRAWYRYAPPDRVGLVPGPSSPRRLGVPPRIGRLLRLGGLARLRGLFHRWWTPVTS